MTQTDAPTLLRTDELAELLQIKPETLHAWRYQGVGPRSYKVGRQLRYNLTDVMDWLETNASDARLSG